MDELSNIVTLHDENGNDVNFEFLDLIEYGGSEHVVLLPVDVEEDTEVLILKVVPTDNPDEEAYVSVDDETMMAVFEIFKEKFKDVFTFEA